MAVSYMCTDGFLHAVGASSAPPILSYDAVGSVAIADDADWRANAASVAERPLRVGWDHPVPSLCQWKQMYTTTRRQH